MLKVVDEGVHITLNGKPSQAPLIGSAVLVLLALVVAGVAMTQSTAITFGAMFVFAVAVFVFNLYKNKLKNQPHIYAGTLVVKNRSLIGGGQVCQLSADAVIQIAEGQLLISDEGKLWRVSGFDNDKELQVAKAVLEGKPLQKQERAIRLMS